MISFHIKDHAYSAICTIYFNLTLYLGGGGLGDPLHSDASQAEYSNISLFIIFMFLV